MILKMKIIVIIREEREKKLDKKVLEEEFKINCFNIK